MAIASLGKTVVYKPASANTDPKVTRIGNKIDTTNSHAAIITKIESGSYVSLTVFLDAGDDIHVTSVKNDDTGVAGHSWMYPV